MYVNMYTSLFVSQWLKISFGDKSIGKDGIVYISQNPLYRLSND